MAQVTRNVMSSLKVSNGCCVVVYDQPNFRGGAKKYCRNTPLVGKDWNNKVSSLRVVEDTQLEAEDVLADWIEEEYFEN